MPQHMTLTPFEWALVCALAVFTWYMLQRDFASRDALTTTVGKLSVTVERLRTWMAENYVTKHDHTRDMDRLGADIAEHAERFERELGGLRDQFPGRRG